MKSKILGLLAVGLLASLPVNANTITVGVITTAPDGTGGTFWTYPIIFTNSAIDSTQATAFNVNDFGPLKSPASFVGPGPTFAITTPLVGPNFGLPGFQPNNPAVADVVITFTSSANLGAGDFSFNLVLNTASGSTGGFANFFSQDRVATGSLAGSPNAVQQNIITPGSTTVPEPATLALLGLALAGLGFVRRKSH